VRDNQKWKMVKLWIIDFIPSDFLCANSACTQLHKTLPPLWVFDRFTAIDTELRIKYFFSFG